MNTQLIEITRQENKLVFDKPGKYVVFFSNSSGTISCRIKSEHVELYLVGLYDMKNDDAYKLYTEQIHEASHSFSDLFILSVADDNSSLFFSGLIRIEKNAQQSHAYQKNQNLILSKNTFIDTRPTLEILADDVFCTHGSTSGPIAKEQLQYLRMRGLNKNEAMKVSIEGFKKQVYDKLQNLGIKNYAER